MRINGKRPVTFHVESNIKWRGKQGIGKGRETGVYYAPSDAIQKMAEAKASGRGATCIVRNADGNGKLMALGLVPFSS